jgi:gamma-glutamylcyclotransferase (GGCT)/AIG2-like uncharacterized protein YtfP
MKLYFAYGANLNIENMAQRCPGAVAIQPWHLDDYRLMFSGVATVVPEAKGRVPGALWAITEACEQSLDVFEGYPWLYRKQEIIMDGMPIMFYVMNHSVPSEPAVSYLETIAQGYGDFGLALDDLWAAVQHTREIDNDMQWSTRTGSSPGDCATDLEDHVHLEPGHDLRRLRDVQLAHRDPDPIQ